jgi:glutamine amidotransferase
MIGIVDYGLGNVQAIANIYRKLDIPCMPVRNAASLCNADRLILPGVGSFDWAMRRLQESGMREALDEAVLARGIPVLGICVGLQMMTRRSDEGSLPGLGWIPGEVKRFEDARLGGGRRLPHMGWNDVTPRPGVPIFRDLGQELRFYFLHSFYVVTDRPDEVLATTDYGGLFACSAGHDNIFGVQFHPEKSHQWGVQLLKNLATC